MEIELKYRATKEEAEKLMSPDAHEIRMISNYYDSRKHGLRDRRITLRCRKENDSYVVTCKWRGGSANGLHKRGEFNVDVDSSWIDKPDVTVLQDCEIYDEIVQALGGEYANEFGELVPRDKVESLLEMRFTRYEFELPLSENSVGIMSYDEGMIITKKAQEPISEIEIELKEGSEDDLVNFGRMLQFKYDLVPEEESKYSRGLALL